MPTLIWEGDVYGATINQRSVLHKGWGGRPKIGRSARYSATLEAMRLAFAGQWDNGPMVGPVLVHVRTYWPRRHNKGAADGQAFGDVDACTKAVLDALEGFVLTDDAQVEALVARKFHDPARPRIEVEVKHWDDGGGA